MEPNMQSVPEGALVERQIPPFLKVVCILSYIGCGIMILIGLFGLKNLFLSVDEILADPNLQMLQQMYPETYDRTVASLQYKDVTAIFGILAPVLSLIGVILMWKLRKSGFFIYLAGEIIPYIVLALTTGFSSLANMGGMMESFQSVINVILILIVVFDILFIILYALNFKHLE